MDSGERGMNPVAMTFINPRREYWPSQGSNQGPVLKSAMLLTELWGLALKIYNPPANSLWKKNMGKRENIGSHIVLKSLSTQSF